jgi:hypothetical protein
MTSKFEQLIEYVINDEEAKAKELFHDIVVEKSREIYENLMSEESEEELEESEEELEESEEELMNDVEAEEQGMQEEESDVEFDDAAEEDGEDLTHDMEKDHDDGADIEDRVVDLEDKLDELMAEFESLMGDNGDSVDSMDGGDDLEMDDTDTAEFGMDGEEAEEEMGMMEAVSLSKVAPAKMGDDGANTKSVVPQNSGAKGAVAHPVKMTGDTAQGRPAPKTGELIGKVQNSVGGNKTMSPATKPVTTQAAGVNTKTPFPKG